MILFKRYINIFMHKFFINVTYLRCIVSFQIYENGKKSVTSRDLPVFAYEIKMRHKDNQIY